MNRHIHRLSLVLALGLSVGCSSLPSVTIGQRGKPTAWEPDVIRQLAMELETVVARSAGDPEDQIVDQVGTELEFGEEEVDTSALLGGDEDLTYEAPTMVDLHVDTVKVASAIRSRQLRAPTLRHWKGRGCLGESAQGKMVFVNCSAIKDDPTAGDRLAFMVIKENRDRRLVYESLLKENTWSNARLHEIRAAFAEAIRDVAPPDHLFAAGGTWAAKDPEGAAREAAAAAAKEPAPNPQRRLSRPEEWDKAETLDVDVNSVAPRVITHR